MKILPRVGAGRMQCVNVLLRESVCALGRRSWREKDRKKLLHSLSAATASPEIPRGPGQAVSNRKDSWLPPECISRNVSVADQRGRG
jgi:hypothetical protein